MSRCPSSPCTAVWREGRRLSGEEPLSKIDPDISSAQTGSVRGLAPSTVYCAEGCWGSYCFCGVCLFVCVCVCVCTYSNLVIAFAGRVCVCVCVCFGTDKRGHGVLSDQCRTLNRGSTAQSACREFEGNLERKYYRPYVCVCVCVCV